MRLRLLLFALLLSRPMSAQRPHSVIREVAKPVAAPPCAAGILCIKDSTRVLATECCDASSYADWLLFPAPGDSLELFVIAPTSRGISPSLTLAKPARRQFWQEHLPGLTAPFLRQRFREPGAYVANVDLSAPDPVVGTAYELRVRPAVASENLRLSPLRLHLAGGESVFYVVRPYRGTAGSTASAADYSVRAGVYRILAGGFDSLEVCRKPCTHSIVVSLRADSARITK